MAVATLATVCVLSVFNGFASLASGRMNLIDPDLKAVRADGGVAAGADSIAAALASADAGRFIESLSPTLEEQALAISGDVQLPVTIRGVGEDYEYVTRIDSAIIDGIFALEDEYGYPATAISVGAAIELQAHPDPFNPIGLYAPRRIGRLTGGSPLNAFRSDSMLVAGVWQTEQNDYDASMAIVSIDRARRLFDYRRGEASSIDIKLHPGADASQARKTIADTLGDGWKVLTREEQHTESYRMIAVEKWISFLMLAFILIIASFNVVSTLSMLIIEKRDNLRTLRALGATPRMAGAIFFWEGWLISMVGGVAGTIVGIGLCMAQQHLGLIRLHGDPTKLNLAAYPVKVAGSDIVVVAVLVALTGAIVGYIASRLARK